MDTPTINPLSLLVRVNSLQALRRLLAVRENSKFLGTVILLFIGGYAFLSFFLFYKGLRFVQRFPGLDTLLTERLMFLLFAFFFILLFFSNLIISYTNLFRNRETAFLLTLPIPRETIFRWKLAESTLLASWAFVFLLAPMLAAYGMTVNAPWHFYLVTVVLLSLFIVLPSVFGALCSIILARFLDRRSFQLALIGLGILFLVGVAFYFKPEPITDEMLETRVLSVLDKMLGRTRFAENAVLPSYWLTASVLNYSEGAIGSTIFFSLVLLSNVLFFGFIAVTRFGNLFFEAASAVNSRGSIMGQWRFLRLFRKVQQRPALQPGLLERLLGFVPFLRQDVRAIILKDLRLFWRDTTQWGQTLVLFGLLAAYIINLRHFSQQLTNPFWINLVSYLNLMACSLNLATLTTRFVFPQFSLEGKRIWIVGMTPLGLGRVVRIKYAVASFASLIITLGLVFASCYMLRLPVDRTLFFSLAVTVMTFSLNGLAVGLGVLYPNFREDNPGKIVSGFGGTFCLVASFLYILAAIVALVFGAPWARGGTQPVPVLVTSWAAFAILSLLVGWMPLKLGLRKIKVLEL